MFFVSLNSRDIPSFFFLFDFISSSLSNSNTMWCCHYIKVSMLSNLPENFHFEHFPSSLQIHVAFWIFDFVSVFFPSHSEFLKKFGIFFQLEREGKSDFFSHFGVEKKVWLENESSWWYIKGYLSLLNGCFVLFKRRRLSMRGYG